MIRRAPALLVLLASVGAQAMAFDGGGRDVTIALFSTRVVKSVTLTPLRGDAWTARCAQCIHAPLTKPMRVASGETFAGGALRVTDDATGDAKIATGLWHVRRAGAGAGVDVVLTLQSERYVEAVLNAEAAPGEPAESLRALAIVVRTYALNGRHYMAPPGHLSADLCDSTECQAMRLGAVSAAIVDAAQATVGETLWFGAGRAETFFSQNCGGVTEDAGAVWPQLAGTPYLRSHADPYCVRRDTAAWHAEISLVELAAIARAQGWKLPAHIVSARVDKRSASHRALSLIFKGSDGSAATLAAAALRLGIGRTLGWNRVRSDAYEVVLRNGNLVFDGHGHGHGVGLCQAGATEMASEGRTAREILAFYFPGTAVRITAGDSGWQASRVGAIQVRSAQAISAADRDSIIGAWAEAQHRFAPRHAVSPQITFAPTTELFRQLTAEPGWALASTRGTGIVLQPAAVLRNNSAALSALLLHEMLHTLVESECNDRTPLWLREGLVEALAGGESGTGLPMSATAIDDALLHADSLQSAQRAHRAAAARVRTLIQRYGFSTVRGWLSGGVPSGVV